MTLKIKGFLFGGIENKSLEQQNLELQPQAWNALSFQSLGLGTRVSTVRAF
jgi:hypothetical protein